MVREGGELIVPHPAIELVHVEQGQRRPRAPQLVIEPPALHRRHAHRGLLFHGVSPSCVASTPQCRDLLLL